MPTSERLFVRIYLRRPQHVSPYERPTLFRPSSLRSLPNKEKKEDVFRSTRLDFMWGRASAVQMQQASPSLSSHNAGIIIMAVIRSTFLT